MKNLLKGILTGLFLQLAIGPVFFFILTITFSSTFSTAFFAIIAVTLVDYLYITLSLLGIGKLLSTGRNKLVFTIVSSVVLVIFGLLSIKSGLTSVIKTTNKSITWSPVQSFTSCFILTISSPMTIVFWSSIFSAKAIELKIENRELAYFGIGAGFATFIFMSATMLLLSIIKQSIPGIVIQVLNCMVGAVLVFYGAKRLFVTSMESIKPTIT